MGDYEELELEELQEEAVCEGVDLMIWDRFRPRRIVRGRRSKPCVDCGTCVDRSENLLPLRQWSVRTKLYQRSKESPCRPTAKSYL